MTNCRTFIINKFQVFTQKKGIVNKSRFLYLFYDVSGIDAHDLISCRVGM